jgi:hypothetical protein
MLLVLASLLTMGCSKDPNAPQTAGINLTQMQADITALKSSLAVLQTTMAAITPSSSMVKQTEFDAFKASVNALSAKVDAIKIPAGYVTTEQLTAIQQQVTVIQTGATDLSNKITALQTKDTALQESVTSVQAIATSLQASVTALQAKDTDLQNQINILKTSVAALATTTTPPTSTIPVTALTVIAAPYFGDSFNVIAVGSAIAEQAFPCRLTITNSTTRSFSNVTLVVSFIPQYSFGVVQATAYPKLTTLTGGVMNWLYQPGFSSSFYSFMNTSTLNIAAGETKTFMLSIAVKFATAIATDTLMFVQPNVLS